MYPSEAYTSTIHKHVHPYYVNMDKSPRTLDQAAMFSSCQGCDDTLTDPYYHRVPLPRVSGYHTLDNQTRLGIYLDAKCSKLLPASEYLLLIYPSNKLYIYIFDKAKINLIAWCALHSALHCHSGSAPFEYLSKWLHHTWMLSRQWRVRRP